VEPVTQILKETALEVPNRKIEKLLRETFSPKREFICRQCSLRPVYCLGSLAEWHTCRYALRINGNRISFPSDLTVTTKTGEKDESLQKEIEELMVKTLQRVRSLTYRRSKISA
jgi:hypothetical protein